jgi:pilus assembly protein CpaE
VATAITTNMLALARSNELKNALSGLLMERSDITLKTEIGDLKAMNGSFQEQLGHADIFLVDLDVNDPDAFVHLRQMVHDHQGRTSIVATAKEISAEGVRALIRHGVDDFVPQPLEPHSLIDAIEAARRKRYQNRHGRNGGKIITVARAKGGMGATTLAVHLAQELATPAKRQEAKRVCLLDFDVQFGDTALYLDLDPRSDLIEIAQNPTRLDTALLLAAMTEHKSGLQVLTAPADPMPLDGLRTETVARILDLAQQEFDYVVVDLPLALAGWHETILGMTDKLYVVTQLSVPAIRQTKRLIEIFKDEGLFRLPLSIVLNRHAWRWNERARLRQCIKALDHGIEYYLPNDYQRALEAANRGVSLFEINRRNRLCRAVRNLAADCRRELAARDLELVRAA